LYAVPERDSIVGYGDAELPVAGLVNERLFDARPHLVDNLLCSGGQCLLKKVKFIKPEHLPDITEPNVKIIYRNVDVHA
jgi:hypothetical protein